jgi:putative ABC transport system permease protein
MTKDPRQEVDEELQFHIEQRTRDFIERGMGPEAARAAARQRFGDTARVREACTSVLTAQRTAEDRRILLTVSWLDVKLGLRMFARYPGLSLVAVAGLAIAIAIGAGYFSVIGTLLDSTVPVEGGDRLVVIKNRQVSGPDVVRTGRIGQPGAAAHDLIQWREQVKSVTELSAFRDDRRNVITGDGQTQLVRVAAMTASGFETTRVPALLGRTLLAEDERPDAPLVIVLAYEQWQRQFNGDPGILGRTVRLDEATHTIVGVMPEGFAFPIRHRAWVPLQLTGLNVDPGAGPSLHVFGRIADGFGLEDARAELAAVGERTAAAFPQSHSGLRPQVMPYTQAFIALEGPEMEMAERSMQLGAALLLLIVAVNVAILVYARTATRLGEITVRAALGASRGRIIMQLFVEALVMSVAAAASGLTLLWIAFAKLRDYQKNSPDPSDAMPYWIELALSPGVIVYVAVLAVIAAVVIGVLPALQATGTRVHAALQQFASRSAGMQLGRTWTALIVVQIALAVAALPIAIYNATGALRLGRLQPAAAAAQLLKGKVQTSRELESAGDARYADRMTSLIRRLEEQPEVSAVTYAERLPGASSEGRTALEVESAGGAREASGSREPPATIRSRVNLVAPNLLDVFEVRVVAGRPFMAADANPEAPSIIVDQAFADRLAPGGNVLGRRIRFPAPANAREPNPWMEIVGVVPVFSNTFSAPGSFGPPLPSLYKAGAPDRSHPATLIVRVRSGDPARYQQRLQEITASVDPTMRVEEVMGVVEQWNHDTRAFWLLALAIGAVTGSVLLLSAAGIYAMMAFTVARRWREIGIRVALGADARRVLIGIFGRASAQIGAGVVAGLLVAGIFEFLSGGNLGGTGLVLFPVVVAVMFAVGLLAAAGPARRGLAVQPTEALRNE